MVDAMDDSAASAALSNTALGVRFSGTSVQHLGSAFGFSGNPQRAAAQAVNSHPSPADMDFIHETGAPVT